MKYAAKTGPRRVLADAGQIWVDATEMVDFNLELSQKRRGELFFRLSRSDPALGFPYSWDALPGCLYPERQQGPLAPRNLDVLTQRLHLGAHLTHYLREQIIERFHHPTHAGISTSKVASKLVGNLHKPANQTLLLPRSYAAFLGQHELAEIPGIGSKTALKLRAAVHKHLDPAVPETEQVTVEAALPILTPAVIAAAIQTTFSSATHIHNLLCGADTNPITVAPPYPTQISIEDTFRPDNYRSVASITPVLTALLAKLLTRIQSDLQSPDGSWLAHPRTLRISTRLHDSSSARTSRSTPFPSSILTTSSAGRLTETALPLLKRLLPPPPAPWSLQLLNIAATNMESTSHTGAADIRAFLRTAEPSHTPDDGAEISDSFSDSSDSEDEPAFTACLDCGTRVPDFALTAHARFHSANAVQLV